MRQSMLAAVPALVPAALFGQTTWQVEHCVFPGPGLPAVECYTGQHVQGTSTPVASPGGQSWVITSHPINRQFVCDFTGINLHHRSEITLAADGVRIGSAEILDAAGGSIAVFWSQACGEAGVGFLTSDLPPGLPPTVEVRLHPPCYQDCNCDNQLNIADWGCFQTRFVAGEPYADCNGVGGLTIADFACFQTLWFVGCV